MAKEKKISEDFTLTAFVLLKGVDFLNHASNLSNENLLKSYSEWAKDKADEYSEEEAQEIRESFMNGDLE